MNIHHPSIQGVALALVWYWVQTVQTRCINISRLP